MRILCLLVALASAQNYRYIARKAPIPTRYCILKNCHNCARSFNHNFGTRASKAVCTAMYHQAGCCDFYIKRSKGILFWNKSDKTIKSKIFFGRMKDFFWKVSAFLFFVTLYGEPLLSHTGISINKNVLINRMFKLQLHMLEVPNLELIKRALRVN